MGLMGLFGKGDNTPLPDLSGLAVDLHSHLIPGIDDGVQTIEESLSLIREMVKLGYRKLITTPHINLRHPNTTEIINTGLTKLKEAVAKEEIPVEIEAAAEYYIEDGFEKLLEQDNLMTFGDKQVLIELSYFVIYPAFSKIIYEMQMAGYNIVLAHAERYTFFHDRFSDYEALKSRDVMLQINFSSLTGHYSNSVRNAARKLIETGWADYAGSDLHNMNYLNRMKRGLRDKFCSQMLNGGTLKNAAL